MIAILLIYIIGIFIHKYWFGVKKDNAQDIIDYPESKQIDEWFQVFSVVWLFFWLVFLVIYLKEKFLSLKSKFKK